jgi:class 3 adenylate cyclase
METSNLRQPLAVVFCDIAGTSDLMAREGDLVFSKILHEFYEHSGRLSQEHDCIFIKFIGDGFLATFANAADGLRFARSIQSLLHTLPALSDRGLGFRFSLHFGDCLCIDTSYGKDVFGNNINLVAYLNDLAQPGQIVISQAALDRMPAEQQALAGPGESVRVKSAGEVQIHRIGLAGL